MKNLNLHLKKKLCVLQSVWCAGEKAQTPSFPILRGHVEPWLPAITVYVQIKYLDSSLCYTQSLFLPYNEYIWDFCHVLCLVSDTQVHDFVFQSYKLSEKSQQWGKKPQKTKQKYRCWYLKRNLQASYQAVYVKHSTT